MRNLKIGTRLTLGFGFVIVLLLVMSGIGAWRMLATQQDNQALDQRLRTTALIQRMAAGRDHILADPQRPAQVPVARVVDPWMARSMVHQVTLAVLRWHRRMDWLEGLRADATWPRGVVFDAVAVRVGVLGLGHLGQAVARAMQGLGFEAAGWSRSPKSIDGLACHHGADGLTALAAWSSVRCAKCGGCPAPISSRSSSRSVALR